MSILTNNDKLSACRVIVPTERLLFYQKLNNIVKENASDPYFGVDQLAAVLKMSKKVLIKECLLSTAEKPCKFILKVRLQLAADLLVCSDEPLQNVAWDSGFLSYSGFWRAFGAIYGSTPSDYRLSLHKNKDAVGIKWSIPVDLKTRDGLIGLMDRKPLIRFLFRTLLDNIENEKFSLDNLAELMDSSPSRLTRSLKTDMQITPMKLLQHLRLLHAASLLSDSSKPIVEIANQTGFFDQAHLCKKFKSEFNCSPSGFRKKNEREDFTLWLENSLGDK